MFAGHRLRQNVRHTIMQGLGLVTIAIAVVGLEPLYDPDRGLRRAVILIAALTIGAVIGETLRLEERLESVGERLRSRFVPAEEAGPSRFVEGFVVASTVFCVGPLTLLGAVEDGLGISIRLLAIKSALDGVAVIGFASVFGWGALASMITIAVYQGGLTALAAVVHGILTAEVLAQLGAVGSLLVLGIGLRLLEIKDVKVVNLSPALILAPVAAGVLDLFL